MDAAAYRDFVLEIIPRTDQTRGFKVLPRRRAIPRWVIGDTTGHDQHARSGSSAIVGEAA